MFCQKCGKEVNDEAVVCIHCGCAIGNSRKAVANGGADEINPGFMILSILIPLVGIILWPVKHKETPKAAKAYGLAGIISFIVSYIVVFALMLA